AVAGLIVCERQLDVAVRLRAQLRVAAVQEAVGPDRESEQLGGVGVPVADAERGACGEAAAELCARTDVPGADPFGLCVGIIGASADVIESCAGAERDRSTEAQLALRECADVE